MALLIQIILLFILPLTLLYCRVVPVRFRLWVLGAVLAGCVLVSACEGTPLVAMGIRTDTVGSSLMPYLLFTAAGIAAIAGYAHAVGKKSATTWWRDDHFLFWFMPISAAQQFIFMGFLLPRLTEALPGTVLAVVASALLFSALHFIYKDARVDFPLAFIGGIALTTMYLSFPNLIVSSLAHMALNFTAVLFSFFTINKPMARISHV
ncbi:MAG: CPBP family intramembrane glutamic endopeptidase [Patescibacteria group bacterium]